MAHKDVIKVSTGKPVPRDPKPVPRGPVNNHPGPDIITKPAPDPAKEAEAG
jgi:hypothetical protein